MPQLHWKSRLGLRLFLEEWSWKIIIYSHKILPAVIFWAISPPVLIGEFSIPRYTEIMATFTPHWTGWKCSSAVLYIRYTRRASNACKKWPLLQCVLRWINSITTAPLCNKMNISVYTVAVHRNTTREYLILMNNITSWSKGIPNWVPKNSHAHTTCDGN